MKIRTLYFFLLIITTSLTAQVSYEPGFIISSNGKKVDCYIKNIGWSNNPEDFHYKLDLNSNEIKTGDLKNVKAFVINGVTKFEKATVSIDRSLNRVDAMSRQSEPDFVTETLFLRTLIEGEVSLYEFQDNQIQRFFYQQKDQNIKQLIYKKFLRNNIVSVNEGYKKQLFDNMKCSELNISDSRKLKYSKKELVAFIQKYNSCLGLENKVYQGEKNKGRFILWVKGGIFSSSFDFIYQQGLVFQREVTIPFNNQSSIRFGAELEYIAPFGKNKWAIFLEPTYQSFDSTADEIVISNNVVTQTSTAGKISYRYLNLPLGIRHYMYLNPKSSIFLNAGINAIIDTSGEIEITTFITSQNQSTDKIEIDSSVNLIFGIGYNYNKKLSLEARIDTTRKLIDNTTIKANYASVGVVLGYKLL